MSAPQSRQDAAPTEDAATRRTAPRIAGPGARSYAFIIDWHIRLLAAAACFALAAVIGTREPGLLGDPQGFSPRAYLFLTLAPSLAIYLLYHPVLEVLMRGRTPGKRIAGVRVVDRNGGAPGIGALLIRNLLRLIDSLPLLYVVGLIATMFSERSQRIGDIAAGTLLVYDPPNATRR